MSKWIDFRALRRDLNFEQVLAHYGIELNIRDTGKGRQHAGPCPLKQCKNKPPRRTFSANMDRGIWQCFSCHDKGNVLDLILLLEGLDRSKGEDVKKAGRIAEQKFLDNLVAKTKQKESLPVVAESPMQETPPYEKTLINEPLDFELKTLDPSHSWFADNGIQPKTVEHFGLGYCSKGWLKERIAIPLRNNEGKLIGYAGKLTKPTLASQLNPVYIFPKERNYNHVQHRFQKCELLYHLDSFRGPADKLVVTPTIESTWKLWQSGESIVVSTFDEAFSPVQIATVVSVVANNGLIELVGFSDSSIDVALAVLRIAGHRNVRVRAEVQYLESTKSSQTIA